MEAKFLKMPILAPELDYVRDIVDPDQVFDPNSAISISRAIKRFLKLPNKFDPALNANQFINTLIKQDI